MSRKTLVVFLLAPPLMALLAAGVPGGSSSPPEGAKKTLQEPCARVSYCTDYDCINMCYKLGYNWHWAKCILDDGKYHCCCNPHKPPSEQMMNY